MFPLCPRCLCGPGSEPSWHCYPSAGLIDAEEAQRRRANLRRAAAAVPDVATAVVGAGTSGSSSSAVATPANQPQPPQPKPTPTPAAPRALATGKAKGGIAALPWQRSVFNPAFGFSRSVEVKTATGTVLRQLAPPAVFVKAYTCPNEGRGCKERFVNLAGAAGHAATGCKFRPAEPAGKGAPSQATLGLAARVNAGELSAAESGSDSEDDDYEPRSWEEDESDDGSGDVKGGFFSLSLSLRAWLVGARSHARCVCTFYGQLTP